MLPPALVSVYREYKKDTNLIASWLASTAKECGYPPDLLSNTPCPQQQQQQPTNTGRLKGKARAAAKKNKGKGATPEPPPVPRYIISIKDFISLAEYISASKIPALSVPEAFFNTLHRVIAVRSSFGESLSRHGAEPEIESDARHSYFVGILEKVAEVLKPFKPPTASASGSSDALDALTNQFNTLEVYEPSQDFLDAPDIPRPQAVGQDAAIYEADPSPTFEDALVAFAMMCKDLSEIRDFISGLWSLLMNPDGEDDGEEHDDDDDDDDDGDGIDPAAVAVVTNTAIEFAANIIEDMLPIFKEHGGAFNICERYMVHMVSRPNESLEEFRQRMSAPSSKDEHYDLSNSCCYFAGTALHKLSALPWNGNTPLYPEGHFGVYDTETDRTSMTGEQKYQQDTIIIGELFLEALALVHHVPDYPITDEFIRGVKKFSETDEIPFSLIFAAQVTLDIHHAIRGYAETSVETLVKRLDTMNNTLQSTIKLHKDVKGPHWSSSDGKWLQETADSIEWFLKDPMYEVKKLIAGGNPRAQQFLEATQKHRLLKRSPILTGLALYHHRAEVHELGIALTNAWGSIILPAHLYNAVTESGYSDCFWTDIEHLYTLFGEEQFFVGGRPDNTADYVTRFMLQIGVSASVFTNRRRHSKKINIDDFSRGGTRFLKSRTPIHNSLRDRYQKNMSRMNWSPENIEEILSRTETGASARVKGKGKKPEAAKALRFSLPELLACLGQAMEFEVQELSFPYMLMHVNNWGFLRNMKSVFDPILRNSFGPTYMQHEWQLPFIIGNILALADGVEGGDESVLELAGHLLDKMEQQDPPRTIDMATTLMYLLSGPKFTISPEQVASMRLDFMPDEDEAEEWEDVSEFDEDC